MNFSNSQAHYLLLKGVKAELSPNYQAPELVSLPYEYVATNDTIINDNECDFQYEIKYLEDYKKRKEEEEEKRKNELKAKAPGLTDKVLEPVRLNSQDSNINLSTDNNNNNNNEVGNSTVNQNKDKNKSNIVSEFEDVPPLDPWDKSKTNADELLQLQMEMNDMSYSQTNNNDNDNNKNNNNNNNGNNNNNSNNNNPLQQNNTNIPPNNNIENSTTSPALSAQSSNMSYSSTYQPPVQPGINTSPSYPPMNQNYRPPPVSNQMFPYPQYGGSQYSNPNANEPPSTNYIPGMPQPYYNNRPYSTATPPPIPSRPNTQDYNSPSPSNRNEGIVNSIVDMGFKRELVLNGMRNYGNDKQKVLDYVMLYSYLEGRGYQPKHIDTAIFLYSFNREKCEKFLSAFMELSEMGFDQEDIKEALIFSENDREAAIDHLTKST